MPTISLGRKPAVTVDGYPGTWREIDARSGFRLLQSVECGRSVPRLVVTSDGRAVAETDGDLRDVLKSVMGPARAANGFAVADRKPGRSRRGRRR